jgi:uncharacterized protein YlxW (UPF0749 family)
VNAPRIPARDVAMPLLTRVMTDTMDEDYAYIAGRRAAHPTDDAAKSTARGRPISLALAMVLALFGALLITAAIQTHRYQPGAERERAALVAQIHAASASVDRLRARTSNFQSEIQDLRDAVLRSTDRGQAMDQHLQRLGVITGTAPVTGSGVQVTVDDAADSSNSGKVLDVDLQVLVNGLWAVGAEAISINGHRLTTLTAIRVAGEAITVNYSPLTPPYVIDAIGNPDTMPADFLDTSAGQTWQELQANYGLQFSMVPVDSLDLPGRTDVTLDFAQPGGGGS